MPEPSHERRTHDRTLEITRRFTIERAQILLAQAMHLQETIVRSDIPFSRSYFHDSPSNDAVPVVHRKIVLVPKARMPEYEGVREVIVRIPTIEKTDATAFPLNDVISYADSEDIPSNDVFVEVVPEDGEPPTRFLLVEDGVYPYEDSDDVWDNDVLDEEDNRLYNHEYMIRPTPEHAPALAVLSQTTTVDEEMLARLLYAYEVTTRANTD
jgi:hypothetical protein